MTRLEAQPARPSATTATAAASPEPQAMPDLCSGTHAFRHTADSALASLAAMQIPASRIQIRRTGREATPDGDVLAQSPRAGEKLAPDAQVRLDVAGLGFTQHLPAGMWDSGGEAEPGTREMLQCIDDPLEKLKHWAHEGAALFRISESDKSACERWMALFGVQSADWPQAMWFRLASLLAQISTIACSDEGIRLAIGMLFHISIESMRYERCVAMVDRSKTSALGHRRSLLGVDTVLGDEVEDLAQLRITLGPVSLKTYEAFAEGDQGKLLMRAFDYLLPVFQRVTIEWKVEDANRCPRLGFAEQNGRLGINSHLGKAA